MEKKFYQDGSFLARWLNGELSDAELKEFESHEDFASFKRIATAVTDLDTPNWQDKEAAWTAFKQRTAGETKAKQPIPIRRNRRWWLAAAAVAVLVMSYLLFFGGTQQDFLAPIGQQKTFDLPDGSRVVLNADSKLRYTQGAFSAKRQLTLTGEAYFSVEEGPTFRVSTPNGSVEVLGTDFRVFSREDKLLVGCYTGRVGVALENETDLIILNPADQVVAVGQRMVDQGKNNSAREPAWMSGNSVYSSVNFTEVIAEIERQFDVTISYPTALENIRDYTGGFPHASLDTALQVVFNPVGYQFEIKGREVTIFK